MTTSAPDSSTRGFTVALGVVITASLLAPSFFRDLWNPDEPRLAALAQSVVEDGHWVIPRVNDEPFIEQPPLQAWLISIPMAIFGSGFDLPWVPRLPSVLLGLALLALVFVHARRHHGTLVASIAVVFLYTTIEFFLGYHRAIVDTSLAFSVSVALMAWIDAVAAPDASRTPSWRRTVIFGLAVGFSFLAKNLVGVVFVGLVVGATAWRLRPFALDRAFAARFALAAALALAVPLPWLVAVSVQDPSALRELLVDNTVGRFFSEGKHDPPWYEFLHRGAAVLCPWLLLALIHFGRLVRPWRRDGDSSVRAMRSARWSECVLWWLLLPFLFVLVSGSKREIYLLPITPAVALAAAVELARWSPARWLRRTLLVARALLAVAHLGLALVGGIWASPLPWPVWGFVFFHAALEYRVWRRRVPGPPALPAALLALLLCVGSVSLVVYSARNERESYVPLCRELAAARDQEGFDVVGVELPLREKSALSYYLEQVVPMVSRGDLQEHLASLREPTIYVSRDPLPEPFQRRVFSLYRVRRKIYVLRVRPPEE